MTKVTPAASKGFTLIEMAIVTILSGLIMAASISYISRYIEQQRHDDTIEVINHATGIISTYSADIYPCPSDRSLGVGDVNYGQPIGFNDPAGPLEGCIRAFLDVPLNTCKDPGGGYCRMRAINVDKNGDLIDDEIYMGGYPVKFMIPLLGDTAKIGSSGTDISKSLDAWGNQLSYAVSNNMVRRHGTPDPDVGAPPQENWGVIKVRDEFGNDTGGVNGNAVYALISHGKDGVGAFAASGAQVLPCTTNTIAMTFTNLQGAVENMTRQDDNGLAVDADNCDFDDVFRQALGNYDAASPRHYDDYVEFNYRNSVILWQHTTDTTTGNIAPHMRNLNTGNVAIGDLTSPVVQAPTEKLVVDGILRAETNVRAGQLCDNSNTCADIDVVTGPAGTAMACPAGQAATRLLDGELVCSTVGVIPNVFTCNPGKFITGFNSDGTVICN